MPGRGRQVEPEEGERKPAGGGTRSGPGNWQDPGRSRHPPDRLRGSAQPLRATRHGPVSKPLSSAEMLSETSTSPVALRAPRPARRRQGRGTEAAGPALSAAAPQSQLSRRL